MNTFNSYRKFDELPLRMTVAEFESTDFYEMTDSLLYDYLNAAGELYNLTRKYSVTILDEDGNASRIEKITASITPDVFLFAHPDVRKDQNTGGYRLNK